MKKIYTILFACMACLSIKAASYTVSISGFSYTPAALSATVGDVITIQASTLHPLSQVDATTWNANGTTTLTGGWGTQTADYTFTVSAPGSIYYVCQAHVAGGMKGRIDVVVPAGFNENAIGIKHFDLFPNPAVNNVHVNFSLTTNATVSAKLMNIVGQEVNVLLPSTNLSENNYSYKFEIPATIASGTYFVVVNVNDKRITKKLVVVK